MCSQIVTLKKLHKYVTSLTGLIEILEVIVRDDSYDNYPTSELKLLSNY